MRIIFDRHDRPCVVTEAEEVSIPIRRKVLRKGRVNPEIRLEEARYTALHVRPATKEELDEWIAQRTVLELALRPVAKDDGKEGAA